MSVGRSSRIGLLRLIAQRIAGPGFAEAADAVREMTALQGQDYAGAVLSVALRTASRNRKAVYAALDSGAVVRSWTMRGTLHLVAAEDLSWMIGLTSERLIARAAKLRADLKIDVPTIERARDVAVEKLSGNKRLSRSALLAAWEQAGLVDVKQQAYLLIWHLAQTGTLCLGPTSTAGEQYFVLAHEWIAKPRQLERDEALGEWALRYFRSHGPATIKDFGSWTKLTAKDVKVGEAIARPHLEQRNVDGVEYYLDPQTADVLAANEKAARGVFLLPGFDEYLLGYQDRSAVLAPEFAQRIVPGSNGVFQPTVIENGNVVGTWKRSGNGANSSIIANPFTPFSRAVAAAVPRLFRALP
jgi:Winged helix DNA-binding domain